MLVAYTLKSLANLYFNQSRLADAEALSQRALAIEEKALGPNHPEVAKVLANLARIREQQGRFADSEVLVKRALKERRAARVQSRVPPPAA